MRFMCLFLYIQGGLSAPGYDIIVQIFTQDEHSNELKTAVINVCPETVSLMQGNSVIRDSKIRASKPKEDL